MSPADAERRPLASPQAATTKWRAPGVLPALLVNIVGGLLYGVSIGFLPVMLQFNQYLGECSRYTAAEACGALSDAGCQWIAATAGANATAAYCGYPDYATVNCSALGSQGACGAHDSCYWRYHKKFCAHNIGWTANQQGALAGMSIVGAMISSAVAGAMLNHIGRRRSLAVAGGACALACLLFSAGWAAHQAFAALVLGELLVGMAAGFVSVVCPMYCGELVPGHTMQQTVGVIFQLLVTFGIFLAAALGLIMDPRNETSAPGAHLQGRFQGMIALQWATAAAAFACAVYMPESPVWLEEQRQRLTDACGAGGGGGGAGGDLADQQQPLRDSAPQKQAAAASDSDNSRLVTGSSTGSSAGGAPAVKQESSLSALFTRANALPLIVGLALSVSQQLTGINAIMIYAPNIAGKLGMAPLLGNFCVALWNFVTCFLPIPLVQRFSCRRLFIATTGVATVACLLTGVAVYPGVMPEDSGAQHALGMAGIVLYIAAFEAGIGPCFYVLAQQIFPENVRSLGTSYTVWVCFVLNAVINWGYPVAQTGISGGPSGDQNLGMGVCFLVFACFGLCCTAFLALKMPVTSSEARGLADGAAADGEDPALFTE